MTSVKIAMFTEPLKTNGKTLIFATLGPLVASLGLLLAAPGLLLAALGTLLAATSAFRDCTCEDVSN